MQIPIGWYKFCMSGGWDPYDPGTICICIYFGKVPVCVWILQLDSLIPSNVSEEEIYTEKAIQRVPEEVIAGN